MRAKCQILILMSAFVLISEAVKASGASAASFEFSLTLGTEWSRETLSFTAQAKKAGIIEFSTGKGSKLRGEFTQQEYKKWLKIFKDLEAKAKRTRDPCQARLFVKVKTNAPYISCFDGKPELEREITKAWRQLRVETQKAKTVPRGSSRTAN